MATMFNDLITGIEDAAVITGKVTAIDSDGLPVLLSYVLNVPAPEGLTFNADGSYLFDPSVASYQSLAEGQQLVLNVPYTATDAQGVSSVANMVITITGKNDAPVAQTTLVAIFENNSTVNTVASATDVDANTTLNYVLTTPAPDGLTFFSDGSYIFDSSVAAYQTLSAGQQLVLTVGYTAGDSLSSSAASNLVITVTGTNDAPVAQTTVNTVIEDSVIIGSVIATDADNNTILSYALDVPTPAGLTFHSNGNYSFDASVAAYQSLDVGQQAVLNVTYTATDEHGAISSANLVITVTGTNDAPVAHAVVNTIVEDSIVIGYVTATDFDANAFLIYALNINAPVGLSFNADGSYRFDASVADYQHLGEGQQAVLNIPYTVTDQHGATSVANLMIIVTGTNDIPVAQGLVTEVVENTAIIGNVKAIDADSSAVLNYTLNAPAPSGLTFNTDGSYRFDTSVADYQNMFAGQQIGLNVAYTVTDDQGASSVANLLINIIGTNDAPIAQNSVNTLAEGTVIFGSVKATDVDANAFLSYALIEPAPAGLSFSTDGSYMFDANAADYQSLNQGQQTLLNIAYTATDDQGTSSIANLLMTVTGTNDAPVAQEAVNTVAEDTVIFGRVTATDVDANAFLSYALIEPAPAGLSFNADGSYLFDASVASYQSLAEGQQLVLNVPYTATDAQGVSSVANMVITITGKNDAPVAQTTLVAIFENNSTVNTVASATDVDANTTLNYVLTTPAPDGLTFFSDGSYIFDTSVAAYQTLSAGQQLVLTVGYTAGDSLSSSATSNLVITVTGTNDAPVAQTTVNTVIEDSVIIGSVIATDADNNTILSYALDVPAPAGLTFHSNGNYSFDASVAAYQSLDVGQQAVLNVTYTATDEHGASSIANLLITVNGIGDAPVAQAAFDPLFGVPTFIDLPLTINSINDAPTAPVFTSAITDDILVVDGVLGQFVSTDVNSADILVYSGGSLDANSQLTVLANGDLKLNSVPSIPTGSISFTASVSDGQGGVADSVVYHAFLGTNTGETIDGDNGNIDEYFFAGGCNDTVNAGDGNDVVFGQAGNDILRGGAGNDKLTGGIGSDSFVFDTALLATNIDTITDFQSGVDLIKLSTSIFNVFTVGGSIGAIDTDLNSSVGNHIIYDNVSGNLYYDANGGVHDDAVQVAVIGSSAHPSTVLSSDFIVA